MARRRVRRSFFKFKPFSNKQLKILTWWTPSSPVKDANGIIADGAIRSGKTLSMSLSFVLWAMSTFNGKDFAMCGKTIASFRRNVLTHLLIMLRSRGYSVHDRRSDNLVVVSKGDVENYFYIFGGKDESSQDLIQGITLAGVFFDEVALMPESFVNQATGRCSEEGSKFWFNCNPENPGHWFLENWIKKAIEKGLIHLHFTMDDNLSLSERIKERYRRMYTGVFFTRFILGRWVAATGAIYAELANDKDRYVIDELPDDINFGVIGIDFGGHKSGHAFNFTGIRKKFRGIVTINDFWKNGIITPEQLANYFVDFVKECQTFRIPIIDIRADSADKTLIAGLQVALFRAGLKYKIKDAKKGPIQDRISLYNSLLATDRWKILSRCKHTIEAFSSAVYDPKKLEDKRLDDGSTNMDSIDSQEYTTESYHEALLYGGLHERSSRISKQQRVSPGRRIE